MVSSQCRNDCWVEVKLPTFSPESPLDICNTVKSQVINILIVA